MPSWVQSENRHSSASSSRSGKGDGGLLLVGVVPGGGGPDAGRVDDRPAAGQRQQLPAGRGVAPLAGPAHVARLLGVGTEQDVGQRRLARARRPEQHDGAPGGELGQPVESFARDRAGGDHLDPVELVAHAVEAAPSPLSEVSTLESTRTGTAPESRARATMSVQARAAHPGVERPGDEHHVDVGRHQLRLVATRYRTAHEQAAALQPLQYALAVGHQPVAHHDLGALAQRHPAGPAGPLQGGPARGRSGRPGRPGRGRSPAATRLLDPGAVEAEGGEGMGALVVRRRSPARAYGARTRRTGVPRRWTWPAPVSRRAGPGRRPRPPRRG